MKVEVMDTTLRDGEQMDKVSFSPVEKLSIAKKLFGMGVDRIEVASARAVKEDEEAVRKICSMASELGKLNSVEVLGFVDFEKSVDWISNLGCKTMNLLTKGSKQQCEGQLRKTVSEHLADIKKTVEYASSKNVKVNAYLEDWSTGMIKSPEFVFEMVKGLKEIGVIRVMLPDTLGILSPWEVEKYISEMKEKFPDMHFDFHAHNDYDLGTSNTLAALRKGVNGIQVTANTLGERAGNSSLYAVVVGAKDFLGIDLCVDEKKFYGLRKFVEGASKIRMQPNAPIVGDNSYRQTAGVHADGDKKGGLYKTKLSPERFGKNTRYSLGKQSGIASIEMNLKQMGMELDKEAMKKITKKVREIGARGKTITQEDLYLIVYDIIEQPERMPFEFIEAKSDVSLTGTRIAYVKVRIEDEEFDETASGDGGYDAIMNALGKIMKKKGIELPKLIDYQPRIPPGGRTDALVETLIEWKNGDRNFMTSGVDLDQTISAVRATEKMINLVLMKYGHPKLDQF